jgi:hypothetical protein
MPRRTQDSLWFEKFERLIDDIRRVEILAVMNILLEHYREDPKLNKDKMLELLFEMYNDRPEITEKLARILFSEAQEKNEPAVEDK